MPGLKREARLRTGCAGHPRLTVSVKSKTWMAGTSPAMTRKRNLRMTAEPDAKLIEQGRKLFAGEWQFVWASPSIETLPPVASMEVAFAGRSNVGKSSLINART